MLNRPAPRDHDPLSYRWVILAFAIVAYGTSHFSRLNFVGIQRFVADDFSLDRGAIGLLGSAFFYSYALFQMPWGIASDRFGSRLVIGLGVLLTAGTTVGFATGQTSDWLFFWRIMSGISAAAIYVPLTGMIAHWFSNRQRSFGQGTLGGVGGALGEGMAYFLLPLLAVYFVSDWREGTNIIAGALVVMGVSCLVFLRSAPSGEQATTRNPFDWTLLRDVQLWSYGFLYSGFIVGIRGTQIWIPIYLTDVYMDAYGMPVNQAVVSGGLFALIAYSLVGRAIGCPIAGRMSDVLSRRGFSRTAVVIGWLAAAIVLLLILSTGVTAIWALAVLTALLGTSVNLFALVPAAISETYGPRRTASITSFASMMGQFAGATALAVSGYVGISLNAQPGNALTEYRGIWLSALVAMGIMVALGAAGYVALRMGWATRPRAELEAMRSPSASL